MKAYKVVLTVIDFDGIGKDEIFCTIGNTRYPNYIYPEMQEIIEVDIGEWSDKHPLNNEKTAPKEWQRLFGKF